MSQTPRGDSGETGPENPSFSGHSWGADDRVVPAIPDCDRVPAGFRGETADRQDHWHVAEWDDVLWWVTDRLERIDPQLWQVAP